MTSTLELNDGEAAFLHLLLTQDVESIRAALHHTAGRKYQEYLTARLWQVEALLRKMDTVLPMLLVDDAE